MMQSKAERRLYAYLSSAFPPFSCLLPVNGPEQSVMLLLTSKISVNKECLVRYCDSHLAESSREVYKESAAKAILEGEFLGYRSIL